MTWPIDFTTHTLAGSTTTPYGFAVYESNEDVTLAAGQMLELQAVIYGASLGGVSLGIGNGTNAIYHSMQGDGSMVLYRNSGGTGTAIATGGGGTGMAYQGARLIEMIMVPHSASRLVARARHDWNQVPGNDMANVTAFGLVGTLTPFIVGADSSRVVLKSRVIG